LVAQLGRRIQEQFYGVDPEISEPVEGPPRLLRGSAYELPLDDDSVEVITTINVIEHLGDPDRALRECARVLRPGGSMLFITPNKWFPIIALSRIFPWCLRVKINGLVSKTADQDTFPVCYRANTAGDIRALANRAGLKVVKVAYLSQHPVYFKFSPTLYRCAALFERGLLRPRWGERLRHYLMAHLTLESSGGAVEGADAVQEG